ncbi:MAG: hypothetical protein KDC34_15860 [Saprospiraceae bacterium]|nr:hypothetical protein [Saprospiraceae bacterium]
MMKLLKFIVLGALIGLIYFHASTFTSEECGLGSEVQIKDLKANSSIYNKKIVTLEGVVTSTFNTPLLKVYLLEGFTGEAIVVKIRFGQFLPKKGSSLVVCGELTELFNLDEAFKSVTVVELDRSVEGTVHSLDDLDDLIFTQKHSVPINDY